MANFSELTRQVYLINDLILADMAYGHDDYAAEALELTKHLLATKYWFIRISYANKKRYILALLNDVRSAWTLSLLLKAMWSCRPKDAVLSVSETKVWSVYDQVPMDHNRTAQPVKTLAQAMINDRKWFHGLDPENQAIVLSELVTVAGGPVMCVVLQRAQLLYDRYRDQQLKNLLECIVVEDDKNKVKPPSPAAPPPKSATAMPVPPPQTADYDTPADKKPHAQKDLENALVAWNAKIKQIRDNQKLEEVEMTFNDGTKRNIWKVNRPKPDGIETVDFIQLLPAYVGKMILSFLPRNQLNDYARVNKYWAFLVDELRLEMSTRQKLQDDVGKLQDSMLCHDTSLEMISQPVYTSFFPSSIGASTAPSTRTKNAPSLRPSERSAGGYSFKHLLAEKLKPDYKKQRPIRNMAEMTSRLERRGATDEHLWNWCESVLRQAGQLRDAEAADEGVLLFNLHFPCPMMKRAMDVPLQIPLKKDPSSITSSMPKLKKNISNGTLNIPRTQLQKRYHLWSRDFSGLYQAVKVASYQSPV